MAIFSTIQNPLTFTFGILGNIISLMVYFAPAPTFYKIINKKSTQGFQSLPYIIALFSSMIWIYYATLKTDATLLITINVIGCVIETIYISIFIAYAPKNIKIQTTKLVVLLNVAGFWVIALSTHYLAEGPTRIQILGWICLVISVCVFAAPLSIMKKVIRTKSVEFMPFGLSFSLALSAVVWFFYGFLQQDVFVALPNIIGFVLGVVQMVLYMVYKNRNKKNIEFGLKLPTSVTSLDTHIACDDVPKHNAIMDTNTNGQAITIPSTQEEDIEAQIEEPHMIRTIPTAINDLIENVIKEDIIHKTSTECRTMIHDPIDAIQDNNQAKNMGLTSQGYLIQSAA
ncbi:bidirectional sugar transporter N3-like [Rutidosis leptorrhynchoides]|uniref:bidirectional sugar transporter N3-like n=1 Tax=Rutidosis leptorrhynchoides TaxID=125765 RepID=UPI003A9982DB